MFAVARTSRYLKLLFAENCPDHPGRCLLSEEKTSTKYIDIRHGVKPA